MTECKGCTALSFDLDTHSCTSLRDYSDTWGAREDRRRRLRLARSIVTALWLVGFCVGGIVGIYHDQMLRHALPQLGFFAMAGTTLLWSIANLILIRKETS